MKKKKVNREEVIEFARELYLTPNEKGLHYYSLQQIADEIQQKFNIKYTRYNIFRWAKKFNWDSLWEEAVKTGITIAIQKKIEKDRSITEQYKDAILENKKKDVEITNDLKNLAYEFIKSKGFTSVSEALKAIELALKYSGEFKDEDIGKITRIIYEVVDGKNNSIE